MGLTMNQWDQLAGGAVEGYQESQANRRDNRKDQREQDAEVRTATEWQQQQDANKSLQDRIAQQEFEAIVQASAADRDAIDNKWSGGIKGPPAPAAAPAPVAPPAALPAPPAALTVAPPAPVAPPVLMGGIGGTPQVEAATGGAIEVGPPQPQPQMGPPQPQPQMGPPQPQEALPTQPPQPAYKSRREEYKSWYKNAAAAHAKAGGLEGLQLFRDQENALSRKQMLGYGMEGVSAMQAGNAGEAVKQLNTMLAVSPEDTGMEWEAYDGKVYLVGPDGKRGKPFNQAAVQGVIENNIKTPENYLNFQKEAREQGVADESVRASKESEKQKRREQTEVERHAPIAEGQVDTQLGISQQNADATTLQAETYADEKDSRVRLKNSQAYANYAGGYDDIYGSGSVEGGPEDWWGKRNLGDIEQIGEDAQKGLLGFAVDSPWISESAKNTELFSKTIGATKDIRMNNHPTKMSDNDAAAIARMAYFNDLNLERGQKIEDYIPADLANTRVFHDDVTGAYMVEYNGQKLLVPPHVGSRIQQNKQLLGVIK